MDRSHCAAALAEGLKAVYAMSFDEALAEIDNHELMSGDVVHGETGAVIHWTAFARQQLNDPNEGVCVEFRIAATDGYVEDWIFAYVKKEVPKLVWDVLPPDLLRSLE